MSAGTSGRQRYRWLLLLLTAAILLAWLVTGGGPGDDAEPSGGTDTSSATSSASPPSSSPTHQYTATTTPDADPATPADGPASGLPILQVAELPPEAARILDLIDRGGPFDEDEDGGTFHNREDLLPDRPVGYYREYTVPTPGAGDRGARRIVAGQGDERYYTGDHYRSFSLIATSP